MIEVSISEEVALKCPDLHVATLQCEVINTPSDPELWKEITLFEEQFREEFKIEDINKRVPVQATRRAYKLLGKDPNRYRPSSESLCRRIIRSLPLYRIDSLVDIVNLVSLSTGYSIGAFDVDKISGNHLILGVGREGEEYEGIGRGKLNIAGLPVYRDLTGGIGTPTSDEERTKISLSTRRLLMIINGYSGREGLQPAVDLSLRLLEKYVSAREFQLQMIKAL